MQIYNHITECYFTVSYRVDGVYSEIEPGRWDITTSDLTQIGSDTSGGNNSVTIQNTTGLDQVYVIKTTSSGPVGSGTDYSIVLVPNDPGVVPDLVSAETSCNHHYCISLSGHNFGTDSYVDIHADISGGPVLKRIQGNDIYNRNPINGLEGISFPIQDFDLQNKLNTTGLCFEVVDSPESSNIVCTTRTNTAPQGSFMGKTVESYKPGTQDVEHTSYVVVGNGEKLRLLGNSWKKIAYNYTVTPNTVLEFSFRSWQQEPEINGIGFIMDGSSGVSSSKMWQVYGAQGAGGRNHDFHDYPGTGWKTYRIPIGETFTGQIPDMVFAGDEDNHVGQNVAYRSPVLIEVPDQYDDVPARRAYSDDNEGDAVAWPGGANTVQSHNFHDQGDVDWSMVWISSTGTKSFKAEMIGANSDTKIKVYKVTDMVENPAYPDQGRFIINDWELVASDSSVGDSFVTVNADAGFAYVMKTESRTGHSGAGTEYDVKIRTVAHSPDEYDDIAIRGFTDDDEGDAVAWPGGANTVQNHNFHDQGDVDWSMVWISSTGTKSFAAEMSGANSDTKIKVYKVTDMVENPAYPDQGRFIINDWELVASDSSVGDSFVTVNADAGFAYVMKTESRTGDFGTGTEYRVKIRTVVNSPDEYDNIAIRGFTDDDEGDAVAWPGGASTVQNHNFHDQGDVDWTMVWISSPGTSSFRADMIGVNSATKIKVYKVIDMVENPAYPSQGRFIINDWVLVGSDSSTGSSFVSVATEADTLYIMKTESRTGTYGPGTNYRVRIN